MAAASSPRDPNPTPVERLFDRLETLGLREPSAESAAGESALSEGLPIPPPTTLPPPEIDGYEILELLGKGGMGVVYQAQQKAANRVVALKMILGGFADEEARARFRTEAHAVASLQHPNVVQVFEVGEHLGVPFFSLEFCAGGGLDKKLNGTPLPAAEAARLVETLARAVQHAHEKGVVHRDLKPANVLLAADGVPKVTDFGLAKRLEEPGLTQTGAVMGTPSYMAPEQASGQKDLGPAADVYALGAVLYECLTGRPPFKAATTLDTLVQVLHEDPVPPRRLQSKTPPDLETVCLKCLQKDPKKRYASSAALAEDLRRYQAGEPIAARPVTQWERTAKWVRRRPAVAAFMALFIGALLGGTGFSTYFALDARQREKDKEIALDKLTERDKQISRDKDDLEKSYAELSDREKRISQDKVDLERSVARGFLRPVGCQESWAPVSEHEINDLWDLARSTQAVRLSFVEQALQSPITTRQLRNRADMAIHAAVGLDPAQRQAVEALLLARLRDESCDAGVRRDFVNIGVALDGSPQFSRAAAGRVVAVMAMTADGNQIHDLADALTALAPRLEPADAAAAARQVPDAMAKTKEPDALDSLGQALAALARRLGPGDTSAAAEQVLDALDKTGDDLALRHLAGALAVLAPRLEAPEASAAARRIGEAMIRTDNGSVLADLAATLAALGPRLEPAEAARQAEAAARHVAQAMIRTKKSGALRFQAVALATLAPRLEPAEAAAAARQVGEVLATTEDDWTRVDLAGALAALALRLEPADAAPAARQVAEVMAKTKYPLALRDLARRWAALAPRLEPVEATRQASAPARHALAAIGGADNDLYSAELAAALAELAPRLEPPEARATGRQALDMIGNLPQGEVNTPQYKVPVLGALAEAFRTLAPRLEAGEASADAQQALDAMAKTKDPYALCRFAHVLTALAPQLEPAEAARQTSAAAYLVSQAVADSQDPVGLCYLAWAWSALAPRLEPAEAARQASAAAGRIGEAMARTDLKADYLNIFVLDDLAAALAPLAPWLGPAEASAAARQVEQAMTRTDDQHTLSDLAEAVAAVAPRLKPAEASAAAPDVMEAMVKTGDPYFAPDHLARAEAALVARLGPEERSARSASLVWAVANLHAPPPQLAGLWPLAEASRPLPGRLTEQQLVDLLKMPTCLLAARQVIVRQLGWQCGQTFANQWEFIDWARQHRPDLDLTSPPVRPDQP